MEHCYNLHITSSFTELSISDIVVSDFVHLADEADIFWLLLLNNSRKTLLLWDWYFFGQNILLFSYLFIFWTFSYLCICNVGYPLLVCPPCFGFCPIAIKKPLAADQITETPTRCAALKKVCYQFSSIRQREIRWELQIMQQGIF